jgi:hypothetical protein
MRIQLTEKLSINSHTIAEIVKLPFTRTVAKLTTEAEMRAAKHFAERHKWILTLRTLPDDIYEALPKGDKLFVLKDGRTSEIELANDEVLPTLAGFSGTYSHSNRGKVGVTYEEVLESCTEANEAVKAVAPMAERGAKCFELVKEYLNRAGFTSPTQMAWSCPDLMHTILHIEQPSSSSYGRRSGAKDIFLARLQSRRYANRSSIRRPKIVCMMPDDLKPYLGEAKLLHTALKDK